MRLWTIQTVEVYNKILETGIHYCDEELSMWLDIDCFVNAYNWMRTKMGDKIGKSEVKYPIWAWYAYNDKNRKPDLRRLGYAEKGTKHVCFQIEVDENKLLLSDFDLWHCVLNDCFVSDDDAKLDEFYTLSEDKQDKLKKESWDKILVKKAEDIPKDVYIQATFFELRKEYIKKCSFLLQSRIVKIICKSLYQMIKTLLAFYRKFLEKKRKISYNITVKIKRK